MKNFLFIILISIDMIEIIVFFFSNLSFAKINIMSDKKQS